MLDLLTNPTGALASLGTLLAAILGVWLHGRRKGRQSAEARQERRDRKARETADEIDDAIAGRDAGDNRKRLGRWARD